MNNELCYRKLIAGQTSSWGAVLLRFFLWVAAQVYSVVIALRNFLYSRGWLKTASVNAAVISVGNITAGGTGKTPFVIWLCKQIISNSKFQISNCGCAILTRGYKTAKDSRHKTQDYGDEPAILTEGCPGAKVIVNPDRVAGAVEAVNKFGAKVLIMDDGFQHRRLGRDLDIVTIDATLPFGHGRMLPAGLLREPVSALKRADAIVITRCDQVSESELGQIEKKLQVINPDMIIAKSMHAAICAKSIDNKETSTEELKDKKIFAFCGIGNPDAFLNAIKKLGLNLVGSKIYNDHYHYTANDIAEIYEEARCLKADLILSTQKDWLSKIRGQRSEVRSQRSEVRSQRSEVRSQRSEVRSQRSEVRSQKSEVRSQKSEVRSQKSEFKIQFAYLVIELKLLAGEDRLRGLIEDTFADKILQRQEVKRCMRNY